MSPKTLKTKEKKAAKRQARADRKKTTQHNSEQIYELRCRLNQAELHISTLLLALSQQTNPPPPIVPVVSPLSSTPEPMEVTPQVTPVQSSPPNIPQANSPIPSTSRSEQIAQPSTSFHADQQQAPVPSRLYDDQEATAAWGLIALSGGPPSPIPRRPEIPKAELLRDALEIPHESIVPECPPQDPR